MFVTAIKRATEFTRPLHTILRYFGESEVYPGAATLFFVNADGWALTCRHVAENLIAAGQIEQKYKAYKSELLALAKTHSNDEKEKLQRKYGFDKSKVAELAIRLVNCVEGPLNLNYFLHPTLDVALLKFSNFNRLVCQTFPNFASNGSDLKQGKFLCRLGFPFPEFNNFSYDAQNDKIDWTSQGRENTPFFPIEGMVTRHISDTSGKIVGIELSTPGLRGQSGGPLFDEEGRVWGMQSMTAHLDLDFDIETHVVRNGNKKPVKESAFLHVGRCIHVNALKEFMAQNGVAYSES